MKILILDPTGMLGHKLMQVLSQQHTATGTIRGNALNLANNPIFSGLDLIRNISAGYLVVIQQVIAQKNPAILINCIGIVKLLPVAQNPLNCIAINALFPHAKICRQNNIPLIYWGTDCVFSGLKSNYSENDPSDVNDPYGKTKFLGEINSPRCLTIRTSIIRRPLITSHGLLERFLSLKGKILSGYKRAIFYGLRIITLSEIISKIISDYPSLKDIQQITSEFIRKYNLLILVKKTYGMTITKELDETFINDRIMSPEKFQKETKNKIPSWEYMINQMYRASTPYNIMRHHHAHE